MTTPSLPDHLFPLDADWAAWRPVALRMAGFPIDLWLTLSHPDVAAFVDASLDASDGLNACRAIYEHAAAAISERLVEIARQPRFREAVLWQNAPVVGNVLDRLTAAQDATARRRHAVVARYLQRYCAKNDTIGFFGPIAWAHVVDEPVGVRYARSDLSLAYRATRLEGWCVEQIAGAVSRLPEVRRALRPRVVTNASADDPRTARILALAEAAPTLASLVTGMVGDAGLGVEDAASAYALVESLEQRGLLTVGIPVPFSTTPNDFEPLALLRRVLATLPDGARATAAEIPARIQQDVEAVAAAAGDPTRLEGALGTLNADFVEATGAAESRSPGRVYAGRGVVFEDCRSALEVTLGQTLVEALQDPLTLLLSSVRWATARIGAQARQHLLRVYRATAGDRTTVPAGRFWPVFVDANTSFQGFHESAFAEVAARWSDILAPDLAARRLTYSSAALRARVRQEFAAPRCGWKFARYHSPDVLVDAPDVAAIRAGNFRLVLGEIHPGRNTMLRAFFVPQYPNPRALAGALHADMGAGWIGGIAPPVHPPLRTTLLGNYTILRVPGALPVVPEQRSLEIDDYEVVQEGDQLRVRRRGGGASMDVLEFFCFHASSVFTSFRLLPAAAHLPRIDIDRLVVQRESWFVDARALDFHLAKSAVARYREVRRLKQRLDLPRFVYAKAAKSAPTGFLAPLVGATPDNGDSPSSSSEKPVFLDLDNPLSVEELSRLARDATRSGLPGLRITEMLPAPDGLWLRDDAGERFTTEFRFACLDRASTFDDEP